MDQLIKTYASDYEYNGFVCLEPLINRRNRGCTYGLWGQAIKDVPRLSEGDFGPNRARPGDWLADRGVPWTN